MQVIPLHHTNSRSCIAAAEKNAVTFAVDLFPNELQDFLILQPVLEQRMKWYLEFRKSEHAGKPVKVLTKKGIKSVIITKEFDPVEPSVFG